MPYTRWLNEIRITDRAWAGEKAAHLGELIHAKLEVPRGVCITAEAYRATLAANKIGEKIAQRIAATEIDDPVDLETAAEEIRAWIENAPMPTDLSAEIRAALGTLNAPSYAVRASRVVDDVPNPAASGLQQAYLAVPGAAVLEHVRHCWSLPWNSRAIYYRHRKKMDETQLAMAVVVQPMIDTDAAGVMFTANPLTGAANEIHIDATWGLGEAIIAARWKPDHFIVKKSDLTIQVRTVVNKGVMSIATSNNGVHQVAVPPEKQDAACLNDAQILALAALAKKVETHFQAAQDIEWGCKEGKISLVQTRPLGKR